MLWLCWFRCLRTLCVSGDGSVVVSDLMIETLTMMIECNNQQVRLVAPAETRSAPFLERGFFGEDRPLLGVRSATIEEWPDRTRKSA